MTLPDYRDRPHRVRPVPFGPIGASTQLLHGRACKLAGWSVIENTGGAAAEFDLIDGGDANGTLVAPVALSSGQTSTEELPHPVDCDAGLVVRVVAGTVRGSVWVITE